MKQDRRADIRAYLFANGQTPVQTLADKVGASLATIRRDLAKLESEGIVERVHGGARISERASVEAAFSRRETVNLAAKRAIAQEAMRMIRPQMALFLDAGTTVLQLARLIRLSRQPLNVFTNGLRVAQELIGAPEVSVTLLGGRLRRENLSLVGPMAEAMLENLWVDMLFLGASAVDMGFNLSSFDADEARLNALMAARAAQLCVLADRSKFGKRATYRVLGLCADHRLITDAPLAAGFDATAGEAPITDIAAPSREGADD